MPSIGAGLVAMLVGWLVDDLLQSSLGTGPTVLVSFVLSTVVFFAIRTWLKALRHG